MPSWIIAVHYPGVRTHSTEWARSRFIIGAAVADGVFTVQGDGILPHHLEVSLNERTATLKSLNSSASTEVQGVPLTESTTVEYPVRIRFGALDMLIDCASASSETSTDLDALPSPEKKRSPISEDDTQTSPIASSAGSSFESTIAFSMVEETTPHSTKAAVQKIYTLKKQVARGGMGCIFLAEDTHLQREVAVKLSTAGDRGRDSSFWKEACVLAHLSHPNIVPVHNVGEDEYGRPFYSMKFIKGRSLQSILKLLRAQDAEALLDFTLPRLLGVFRKVCDAIEFAHAAGYLHRDLKPDNIMIGEYGEVLVMDWGLAQPLLPDGESDAESVFKESEFRAVEGTPQYMSPEQASAERFWMRAPTSTPWGPFSMRYCRCARLYKERPFKMFSRRSAWVKLPRCNLRFPTLAGPDSERAEAVCLRPWQPW